MQPTLKDAELVGFVRIELGSVTVQVPLCAAPPSPTAPLATFQVDGREGTILIRGETSSKAVEAAMPAAVREATRHFSRMLLN